MSMLDLFRLEADEQSQALTAGLLALERVPGAAKHLEACMRAAHSLKGAARIVGIQAGVTVAHALEDCFVAAQRGELHLNPARIDLLLRGVDLLNRIATTPSASDAGDAGQFGGDVEKYLGELKTALESLPERDAADAPAAAPLPPSAAPPSTVASGAAVPPLPNGVAVPVLPNGVAPPITQSGALTSVSRGADAMRATHADAAAAGADLRDNPERALRVTAEQLNRLVGVAAESLVESRWLKPFAQSLLRLKRRHYDAAKACDVLRETLPGLDARAAAAFADVQRRVLEVHALLTERLAELETFDSRSTNLAHRLYDEALACRMRPFADGVAGFPRMVRDLARTLGKNVRLDIIGQTTWLDRDILERLEAPLGHLLRNALDHGIESPQERGAAGKSAEAVVSLEARHSAGMLQIVITDDGRGMDVDALRAAVVERKLTTAEVARSLSDAEIFEFLFLPGFSLKGSVTEISGRGVGLDVVRNMLKAVGGSVRVTSQYGKGSRFSLALPLSLSVVRTLLAEVGGEPYAFPLAYIVRTLKLRKDEIESVEGRQLFEFDGRPVGLVGAQRIFHGSESELPRDELPVIVVGENGSTYGLVADRFLGERELVVQALDARLGKIKNIASGALMEDGSPTLVVDVDDVIHSIEALSTAGALGTLLHGAGAAAKRKRVLVVDDSLTVRELERKLLDNAGYEVEVAVNGMDGWNCIRTARFDLIVTDIDMPRMDGIELVGLIKNDPRYRALPVVIVSYKDREEDRRRGLEAGADYFLSKGSFHDETLLQAVIDLIGAAAA